MGARRASHEAMARASRSAVAALAGALASAVLLAACALIGPPLQKPQLSLVGVELRQAQLMEQRFVVRLRVQNPNDRALPIRGIECAMELAGERFGNGTSAAAFTVPARGEAVFDMLVVTNLAASLSRLLPQLTDAREPLDYRLVGTVSTDLAFLRSIPFDQRGELYLR
jgi:LEA14-like dessication related protein